MQYIKEFLIAKTINYCKHVRWSLLFLYKFSFSLTRPAPHCRATNCGEYKSALMDIQNTRLQCDRPLALLKALLLAMIAVVKNNFCVIFITIK